MEISYSELYTLFIKEVSKIENLKQFCLDNQLENQYPLIVKLMNRTTQKRFTAIIINVLEKMDYQIEMSHTFLVHKKSDNFL